MNGKQGITIGKIFVPLGTNTFGTGTFTDLTVTNNLIAKTLTNVETVSCKDNLIVINAGQTGSEITADEAGLAIDRGSSPLYKFVFEKISGWFKVGAVGSLQRVATCENAPIDTAIAYYDAATKKFVTDNAIKRSTTGSATCTNLTATIQLSASVVRATKIYPIGLDLQIGQSTTTKNILFGRNLSATFEEQARIADNGDFSTAKVMNTVEGGIAIKLSNNTGAALLRGYLVNVDNRGDGRVKLIPIAVPDAIGVVYQDIPNGASGWIVVSGMAYVIYVNDSVCGYLARSCNAGDTAAASGKAFNEIMPSTPLATDNHFREIGHVLETKTAGNLVLTALHFN